MSMRHLWLTGIILATACGTGTARQPDALDAPPGASSPSAPAPADPSILVGRWDVDVDGEQTGEVLVLRDSTSIDDSLSLRLRCGLLGGGWKADRTQALFVGSLVAGDGGCFSKAGMQPVPWLADAAGFRASGMNRLLTNSAGAVVATLRPASGTESASPSSVAAPEPAPLPADAAAPTSAQLQHRWAAVGAPVGNGAFVAFGAAGSWHGSDGCNRHGGRFVLGAHGRILATRGLSTLIGCFGSLITAWVSEASRVGLLDDLLVFYDAAGKELGRAMPNERGDVQEPSEP